MTIELTTELDQAKIQQAFADGTLQYKGQPLKPFHDEEMWEVSEGKIHENVNPDQTDAAGLYYDHATDTFIDLTKVTIEPVEFGDNDDEFFPAVKISGFDPDNVDELDGEYLGSEPDESMAHSSVKDLYPNAVRIA